MSHVIAFFKTRTGVLVLLLLGLFTAFYFIREYRERNGPPPAKSVAAKGEALLGQMAPEENRPAPDKPVPSQWVKEATLERFRPPAPAAVPVSTAPSKPNGKTERARFPELIHFYEEPEPVAIPEPNKTIEAPRVFAPMGTLIPCQLILTVDSSSLETPVAGFVTEDLWHNGHLIVPAGTEVHASAKRSRVRDRIEVSGTWTFVWHDGRQYQVRGLALDREHNAELDHYGLTDGSAGIRGEITKSDQFLEYKLFAATMIGGAARASEDSVETVFGSRPSNGLENAGLEGMSTVAERYARLLLDQIEGDGLFVRVPAGTAFYVYTQQVFEPELASVAGLEQGEQPRNSWQSPTQPSPPIGTGTGTERDQLINQALNQRDILLQRIGTQQP